MRYTAILSVSGVPVECTFDHTPGRRATFNGPAEPEEVEIVTAEIAGEPIDALLSAEQEYQLERAAIAWVARQRQEVEA